jgi:transposase-like protein
MIEKEFCQNKKCPDYGKKNHGNLIKYGKYKDNQIYKCKTCDVRYVETKGTIFYNRKFLTKDDIILICKLLVEKNGIRPIERITGHHRDTIGGLLTDLATHAEKVNDFLLDEVRIEEIELDEFWTFVKKSKRNLTLEMMKNLETAMAMSH